jgi:hypothetical protein
MVVAFALKKRLNLGHNFCGSNAAPNVQNGG